MGGGGEGGRRKDVVGRQSCQMTRRNGNIKKSLLFFSLFFLSVCVCVCVSVPSVVCTAFGSGGRDHLGDLSASVFQFKHI